jgi:hypothetical protein
MSLGGALAAKKTLARCTGALALLALLSGDLMANGLEELKKVGEAKLTFMFWDVYQSHLYTETGEYLEDTYPVALDIQYLRDIKAKDLVHRTAQEWQKLGLQEPIFTPWLAKLEAIWPNIVKNDKLLLVVDKYKKSTFYYNGQEIGELEDPAFGPGFLAIWLDDKASYPQLRKQLIGQAK